MTAEAPRTVTLDRVPPLLPLMLRGAALSPLKRPRPGATAPTTRLTVPALPVDQAHLTAYERLCGFPTGPAGLPVTYPHVLGFPLSMRLMADRAFPLPLLGLVHTTLEITQHHDLSPGDRYDLTVTIPELRPHRRGTEAVVVTELTAHGETVWTSASTYLARHATTPPPAPAPSPATQDEPPLPALALAQWPLGADLGRRYAAVSGDRNPIHLHPLTARALGFPRAIAHGMWTVARCLAEHGARGPVHVRAAFKAPVLLPGTVAYAAKDETFELRSAKNGRLHLTGEVTPHTP
ncbi:MaoC/PaaZ C-terminal domain-containing protein [Streptomyces sp. NPDC050145]|uniref:MaoC/PaaZ C-terminal domain-containing protein n=1 Tax=Streptomyces sp. NPDC050145 TaxID=3365602 RepID=UPI0037A3C5BF